MKKIVKNTLMVSLGATIGFMFGYRVATKIAHANLRDLEDDDIEYVKTPNDHVIINFEEDNLSSNEEDSDIDVDINDETPTGATGDYTYIPGVEREPFDSSEEGITI